MVAWLFVAATLIAIMGILFAFRKMMSGIQEIVANNEEISSSKIQKAQTNFFIGVALAESVPILLIVFGFIQLENRDMDSINDMMIPLIVIIGIWIYGVFNIWMARKDTLGDRDISKESKMAINTMAMIGVSLISAIPIISLIALFTINP